MSVESIVKLKEDYLKCLDITEESATLNAEYIYENLKVVNEEGTVLMKDDLMPVVRFVEYIGNEEMYEKYLKEKEETGEDPEWAKEFDFDYKGLAIAYLDEIPEYKYCDVSLIMMEASDFKNEQGECLLTQHKVFMAEDAVTGKVH